MNAVVKGADGQGVVDDVGMIAVQKGQEHAHAARCFAQASSLPWGLADDGGGVDRVFAVVMAVTWKAGCSRPRVEAGMVAERSFKVFRSGRQPSMTISLVAGTCISMVRHWTNSMAALEKAGEHQLFLVGAVAA